MNHLHFSARAMLFVAVGVASLSVNAGPASAQIKPRIVIAFDTSGSMAVDFGGIPTFGDGVMTGCTGSPGNPYCGTNCTAGIDTNCDGLPNDSRIAIAKNALRNMVLAFGDVEWSLARFPQNEGTNLSCLRVDDFECNTAGPYVTSYGNPQCNTGGAIPRGSCPFDWPSIFPAACRPGSGGEPPLQVFGGGSPTVCTNYAGQCGNGDFLVTFPGVGAFAGLDNESALLKWIDNQETNFNTSTTAGNFCNHRGGGDCELRPEGGTPLDGLLTSVRNAVTPIQASDTAAACRPYSVILLTDGAETCGGNPNNAAAALLAAGIQTYVVGMAISGGSRATLNAIATAGGTDAGAAGGDTAFFANNQTELAAGLADIVRRSLLIETCNGLDDNCNALYDEGFPLFCNRPAGVLTVPNYTSAHPASACVDPGETVCDGFDDNCNGVIDEGFTLYCDAPSHPVRDLCVNPGEVCDGIDNNCNGVIDEGGVCSGCVPSAEICDGLDNNCNGAIDEGISRPCGTDVGVCTAGTQVCSAGSFGACSGTGPSAEVCDGLDNDCDGVIDGNTQACGSDVGACQAGLQVCTSGSYGTCAGSIGPSAEVCDGIDNNCNGSTDEGNPGGGAGCGTSIGECTPGTLSCLGGSLTCTGGTSPGVEVCDGLDNDCNGVVDDGVPPMGSCGSSVGECRAGSMQCVGGSFTCVGGRGPTTDICDGLDNDCDGSTDEGNPGGGASCGTATGICTRGTTQCTAGTLTCVGGTGPGVEVCNGLDDDCDGLIDEGNPGGGGSCGTTDVGECDFGAEACVGGSLVCVGETGPSPEICDGLDNDCDGLIDEGDPEGGAACGDATGECTAGTTRCTAGALVCAGGTGPTSEICDGLDNDCDGVVDEGLGVGAPCGTDVGECAPGVSLCRGGAVVCEGAIDPVPETCNGLDDDCDGVIDNGLGLGAACGTDVGTCMAGAQQCVDGRAVCVGEVPPGTEVCDCEDNDCDGMVDEEGGSAPLCPAGSACVSCSCSLPCVSSEFGFTCPTGKAAQVDSAGACFCVAERCDPTDCGTQTIDRDGATLCTPDSSDVSSCACKNNACTFPCDGVVCADGTVCDPRDVAGRCVEDSCRGLGCGTGEVCNTATGACEVDACASVTCASGEACRAGTCEASCADASCAAGEVCRAGACTADACAGVSCALTEVCNLADGSCVADGCRDRRCPAGSVCDAVAAACVADPCDALHCPDGELCRQGECTSPSTAPDAGVDAGRPDAGAVDSGTTAPGHRVLATGRGGCSCAAVGSTPSGTPPALPALLALGLVGLLWRRRRGVALPRPRGVAALLGLAAVALVLGSGCDVQPYCLDCVDASVDAGDAAPVDTGVVDTGPADTGVVDSGPADTGVADAMPDGCMPSAPELCNGLDDNCNGEIDEGIDVTTDPNNCGACGVACAPAHAFGSCADSVCGLASCDVGFYDLNGDLADGCEYHCLPTAADDTICDLRDNDCDGLVDEDVAFDTDPTNCGSCGRSCRFAHVTTPACTAGSCVFDASGCEPGFYDINGVPDDGCEYACTAADPAVEVCNGRDDDCDGVVDEGDPDGGGACGSNVGACSVGVEHCTAGILVCTGGVNPTTELCNGIDDDCDGTVDQGNPESGATCGPGTGACIPGRMQCTGGSLVCTGATSPTAELCNGLDDDCDGVIDNGDPGGGASCGSAVGACVAGTVSCTGGVLVCGGGAGPTSEICDGVDNDCDGSIDEGNPGGGGTCGTDVGACLPGTRTCMGGTIQCIGAVAGTPEVCDGVDNNCNGSIDEGNPGGGASCGTSVGACTAGSMTCIGGALACRGGTGGSLEVCNGIDDDCDGTVDNGFDLVNDRNNCGSCGNVCSFPNAVAGCSASSCTMVACLPDFHDVNGSAADGCEYSCVFRGTEICNGVDDDCDRLTDEGLTPPATFCNANGVCAGTSASCGGASGWQCSYPATYEITETKCDGLDNDCDGATDEPFPLVGTSCGNGIGACATTGSYVCNGTGTGVACNAPPAGAGSPEVCNNLDDDCNGVIDDGIGPSIPVVTIPASGGGNVDVMVYEASRPDATSTGQGNVSAFACSNANVQPWTTVTWTEADAACRAIAVGWRLCDAADWQSACESTSGTCNWSYSSACSSSNPARCNGNEYDCDAGTAGNQDCLLSTGSPTFPACYADWGGGARIYDLSGNAKEWTNTQAGSATVHQIRGGSFNNIEAGRTCQFDFTVGDNNFSFTNTGFRCCHY